MIRTYLEFHLLPGRAEDLCRLFRDERILERSVTVEGCHSAELTVSPDGSTAIVTAEWDDDAAYERWINRPDRTRNRDGLEQLLDSATEFDAVAQRFTVVHRAVPGAVE